MRSSTGFCHTGACQRPVKPARCVCFPKGLRHAIWQEVRAWRGMAGAACAEGRSNACSQRTPQKQPPALQQSTNISSATQAAPVSHGIQPLSPVNVPAAPVASEQDVADILSTMPTTMPTYDRTVPLNAAGNVDLVAYKQKVADLLNAAGSYTGTNITRLAGFTSRWDVDIWFAQALKIADIDGLDNNIAKAQKLIHSNTIKSQPIEVVKQARKFVQQYEDYMATGDYVRANNALKGFINLHDLIKAKVNFGEVSMLMPKELLTSGKWLGTSAGKCDKAFFDLFGDYVPVTIKNTKKADTFYSPNTRSVCLNIGDTRYSKDA